MFALLSGWIFIRDLISEAGLIINSPPEKNLCVFVGLDFPFGLYFGAWFSTGVGVKSPSVENAPTAGKYDLGPSHPSH